MFRAVLNELKTRVEVQINPAMPNIPTILRSRIILDTLFLIHVFQISADRIQHFSVTIKIGAKEHVSRSSRVRSRPVKMMDLGVVIVDSILGPFQQVGDSGSHSTPFWNERNHQWILNKSFARQFNPFRKGFHSNPFLMTVKIEPIDCCIITIFGNRLLSSSQICPLKLSDGISLLLLAWFDTRTLRLSLNVDHLHRILPSFPSRTLHS